MMDNRSDTTSPSSLHRIVAALQQRGGFDHSTPALEIIETHISIVLLTGDYAYKFKKPVDLGFVDFTTLEKRRFYCEEELRLNRRLAPELYLDVVAIGGDPDNPVPGGEPAIEYCVKMRQFPRTAELDRVVAADAVEPAAFAELASEIAAFHEMAAIAEQDGRYGTPAQVRRDCMDNFEAVGDGLPGLELAGDLKSLRCWTEAELNARETLIAERHRNGRVRECHGDMHLTNMVWLDGCIRVFDCIEFNAGLRWIDVMNEVAFLLMDLDERGHPEHGRAFLNAYLEAGGDYTGLVLLRLFKVYRSMVRAKVALLRARQDDAEAISDETRAKFQRHVRLARRYIEPAEQPALIITHGLSGSGKTRLTRRLIPIMDVVRVRSDVERKRLEGLTAAERSDSDVGQGLYSADHTERTYQRLAEVAHNILDAGMSAIVDATFLKRDRRRLFQALAEETGCRFVILECTAPEAVLRERVAARARKGRDASEADVAVLEKQLATADPLTPEERRAAVTVETTDAIELEQLSARLGLESGGVVE
jgi:uncharacterized protein